MLGRPPPPPPLLDAGVASESHLPKGFAETLPGGPAENNRKPGPWAAAGGGLRGVSDGFLGRGCPHLLLWIQEWSLMPAGLPLGPFASRASKQLDLLVFHRLIHLLRMSFSWLKCCQRRTKQ